VHRYFGLWVIKLAQAKKRFLLLQRRWMVKRSVGWGNRISW
jgi:hypothetical protein